MKKSDLDIEKLIKEKLSNTHDKNVTFYCVEMQPLPN